MHKCKGKGKKRKSGTDDGSDRQKKYKKPVLSSDDLRVWAAWLIRIMETTEFDWEEWLIAHINFVKRLNETLKKAEQPQQECSEVENVQVDTSCEERVRRSNKKLICKDMKDNIPTDIAIQSGGINSDDQCIEIPGNLQKMEELKIKFNEGFKKFQDLYQDWIDKANKVNDEIEGKLELAEPMDPDVIILHFQYLKDTKTKDLGIEFNMDVPGAETGREMITSGKSELFYNLIDP